MTFDPDVGRVDFLSLVKETPAQMVKHTNGPSYVGSEGADTTNMYMFSSPAPLVHY